MDVNVFIVVHICSFLFRVFCLKSTGTAVSLYARINRFKQCRILLSALIGPIKWVINVVSL